MTQKEELASSPLVHTGEELQSKVSARFSCNWVCQTYQEFENGPVHVLEHHVQPGLGPEELKQAHNIGMLELFEDARLSDGGLADLQANPSSA
jgi:hypothetical protein